MNRRFLTSMVSFLIVAVVASKDKNCMVRAQDAAREKDTATLQDKAKVAKWRWSDYENNLLYCVANRLRGYEVRVIRPKEANWHKPFRIEILDGPVQVCSFAGHAETVFAQLGDVLYVADLLPLATGCTVVAFDLKGAKELWRCYLKGNPPDWHSKYRHQVNIGTDGGVIVVYGRESNGRYIEYVDAKAGKTVGHKKLPPER